MGLDRIRVYLFRYDLRLCILAVMDDVDRTLPIGFFFSSTMTEMDVRWCLEVQ